MVTLIGMGSGKPESLTAQAQLAALQRGPHPRCKAPAGRPACRLHWHRQAALYQPADILAALAQNPGQDADTVLVQRRHRILLRCVRSAARLLRVLGIPARVLPGRFQHPAAFSRRWAARGRTGSWSRPMAAPATRWPSVMAHTIRCSSSPAARKRPPLLCQKLTAAGLGDAHGLVGENLGTAAEAIRFGLCCRSWQSRALHRSACCHRMGEL
ncbi:MAG: hypothetical protein ACLVJH_07360 [Faecalibacterium prausnitzii]